MVKLKDGEPFVVQCTQTKGNVRGWFWHKCCDCGLVHKVVVEKTKKSRRIVLTFWRKKGDEDHE